MGVVLSTRARESTHLILPLTSPCAFPACPRLASVLAAAGLAADAVGKWKACWKEAAGARDYTTWDGAAWAAAGAEGGFDGAKVVPAQIFFLFVNMSEADGAQLAKVATSWGLDDGAAASFVQALFRIVDAVTAECFGADATAEAKELQPAVEAALGAPVADYKPPLRAAPAAPAAAEVAAAEAAAAEAAPTAAE